MSNNHWVNCKISQIFLLFGWIEMKTYYKAYTLMKTYCHVMLHIVGMKIVTVLNIDVASIAKLQIWMDVTNHKRQKAYFLNVEVSSPTNANVTCFYFQCKPLNLFHWWFILSYQPYFADKKGDKDRNEISHLCAMTLSSFVRTLASDVIPETLHAISLKRNKIHFTTNTC